MLALRRATRKGMDPSYVEFLEKEEKYVFGYYETKSATPADRKFRQHISVVDKDEGRLLFEDVVNENVAMTVPETFFGMDSFVYYVKQKSTLRAVKLSGG